MWKIPSHVARHQFFVMATSDPSHPMLAPQFLVLGYCFHENNLRRLGRYHACAFLTDIEEAALGHTRIAGFLKHGTPMKLLTYWSRLANFTDVAGQGLGAEDSFLVWFYWPNKGFLTLGRKVLFSSHCCATD